MLVFHVKAMIHIYIIILVYQIVYRIFVVLYKFFCRNTKILKLQLVGIKQDLLYMKLYKNL